jgi:4-amino-4-deoxy-L-arabinose transferase-like glycosyltransferase
LFAGFLPINLYMSQWVGNEALAGVLGSGVLVLCLSGVAPMPRRRAIGLGVLLGLAILSKVSALMLVPVALGYLFWRTRRAAPVLWAGLACALVCGWYFARNWIGLGQPLVLSSADVDWWQAPGYRSWQHLWHFGVSLTRPVMAGLNSFGDAVYSTLWLDGQLSSAVGHAVLPWRFDFLLACAPLALVPSLLLLIGFGTAWLRRDARLVLLAAALAIYFAALLQQYMALPIFSTGKASYTLALLPAYGLLAVTGVDAVARRLPQLVGWLAAYLCAFGVFAYWSYLAA